MIPEKVTGIFQNFGNLSRKNASRKNGIESRKNKIDRKKESSHHHTPNPLKQNPEMGERYFVTF